MNAESIFRVDDMRPVLAALRERGIAIDPRYPGECRQMFENRGIRINYHRKRGLSIDSVAELLYDRNFLSRPIFERECLDILEMLFTPQVRQPRRKRASARAVDKAERKARAMRCRKFACDKCGQIARGTRSSDLLCGTCARRWAESLPDDIRAYVLANLPPMTRRDPLPEEILASAEAA